MYTNTHIIHTIYKISITIRFNILRTYTVVKQTSRVNKSPKRLTCSKCEDEILETRVVTETEKEKLLRKRKRQEKEDAPYVPSPQHVSESQSPPSGGRKKAGARKRIVSPKIKKVTSKITKPKIVLKKKPSKEPSKPPTPPPESTPHQSPIQSPPHQTPPRQPTPQRQPSPFQLTPPHSPQQIHTITPSQETALLTSQEIFKTPPPTQIPVQLTPGSSGHKTFPTVPENLQDIADFGFANDEQVKKLQKKMDDVLNENKRLAAENKKVADREKILEMRVKRLESDNKALLKKIDTDQTEIDFLKVRVAELEEDKTRRDEQNKYFELKNREFEAAKALREHEFYMLNKVVENMLGKSIEQKFEEIQVEDLRTKREAELDAQMKDKGKGVESSFAVEERSIVPSLVDVLLEDDPVEGDDVDDEDDDDDEEDDDDEKVFSASSHGSGDDNNDDDN
ncbi:hypothetical protein HanHA300_Chr02g0050161 [Helianthus annuus]|nr:hypothetical protein HanHA300_Chr02g0050161 [Helianthus annuus]KAJ0951443.1 hypothetical protein HanPSC8_Chr02g0060061 [Helianthus annuus]